MLRTPSEVLLKANAAAARGIARLPAPMRAVLRRARARLAATRRGSTIDEWGRARRQLSIADWSLPIAPGPALPVPFDQLVRLPADPAALTDSIDTVGVGHGLIPDQGRAAVIRCALVCSAIDVGGLGEVVALLATRLRGLGIECAVMVPVLNRAPDAVPTGRIARQLLSFGVSVVEADSRSGAAWLASWRPDVVYAHASPLWVLAAATELGVPYIDTLHGMHSLFDADWAQETARSASIAKIVAVSEIVRSQYLTGNPSYPGSDIVTIPNAVDGPRFDPAVRDTMRSHLRLTNEFVFVSLARHCLQKNTYGLIAAFADVARYHPEAHLVIAGRIDDDRYFRQVARLLKTLPFQDRVHLRGHLSAPRNLVAAADCFVLNSFFEGWALAPMESLTEGVPVVVSDVGGAREQIGEDAGRGILVANPLGDPLAVSWETIARNRFSRQVNHDELVRAMSTMVTDRDWYLARRAHLAEESADRFDIRLFVEQHAALVTDAASTRQI